jgi:hypothetical protein
MGKARKTLFAALAAAAVEQARKPENQRRVREMVQSWRNSKGRGPTAK